MGVGRLRSCFAKSDGVSSMVNSLSCCLMAAIGSITRG